MEAVLRAQDGEPCRRRGALRLDRPRASSRTATARASPSPKGRPRPRGAGGRLRRRLRRRPFARARADRHRRAAARFRSAHGAGRVPLARAARRPASAFRRSSTYRVMHPDLNGYWQFFGRIDVGEGLFFHAPVPTDTTRDNFDFHGPAPEAAGFPFTGRVRSRRLLGPARRGRRELPGRARVHRRRRRAQPSALWRRSASTTGWKTQSISAGSSPRS